MAIVAVVGALGKMGVQICRSLKERGHDVREVDLGLGVSLDDVEGDVGVVVDFSSGAQSSAVLEFCVRTGAKLIMGTTGQNDDFFERLRIAATKIPIIKCSNFSANMQRFIVLAKDMSRGFRGEIVVVETHHRGKIDAPSGTAKMIIGAMGRKDGVECCSIRGGTVFGKHEIHFFDGDEEIVLAHESRSRKPFVDGVLCALEFLDKEDRAGLYDFGDIVLGRLQFC